MPYDPKDCTIERATKSRLLTPGPALIFSVAISGKASGAAEAKFYNGESAAGELKYDLKAWVPTMTFLAFNPPLFFPRGVYVDFTTNIESVTLQYSRARD